MRHDGGLLIALGAGLGLLVSIWNYFASPALLAPTADISHTPAALLAIAATAILFLAGLVLGGRPRGAGLTTFLVLGCARRHRRHRARRLAGREHAPPRPDARRRHRLAPPHHHPPAARMTRAALCLRPRRSASPAPPRRRTGRPSTATCGRRSSRPSPRSPPRTSASSGPPGASTPATSPTACTAPRRMHGAGRRGTPPPTVWSATPLFVNDTLYVGTPFYRILALEPDTGAVKWTYDSHAVLEALTQPDLKNRGVAYWAAAEPAAGQPCQKRIYLGTMDAKLHAVDADTGQPCADFGQGGVLDFNAFNTTDARWPLSLLQPPTVFGDTLFVGWAGKDWAEAVDSPGSVYALDARTGAVKWTFETLPPELRGKTGTANVWASMSVDPERHLLYIPVSSPSPNFFQGAVPARPAPRHLRHRARHRHRRAWSGAASSSTTTSGTSTPTPRRRSSTSRRTAGPSRRWSRPRSRASSTSSTARPASRSIPIEERPVPQTDVPGEISSPTQPFVDRPARVIPDRWPGVSKLADFVSGGWCTARGREAPRRRLLHPAEPQGHPRLPRHRRRHRMGRRRGRPVERHLRRQLLERGADLQAHPPRRLRRRRRPAAARPAASRRRPARPTASSSAPSSTRSACPAGTRPTASMAAYDLKTGDRLWNVPFGQVQKFGFYMPEAWGSLTIGGPVITASGLVFAGASMDSRVRALDLETGEGALEGPRRRPRRRAAGGLRLQGPPVRRLRRRRQLDPLPRVSDQVIAFALPAADALRLRGEMTRKCAGLWRSRGKPLKRLCFPGAGIRLESGWKAACHFLGFLEGFRHESAAWAAGISL